MSRSNLAMTAIIPIDFSRRSKQLLNRTTTLVQALAQGGINVVIGHNDRAQQVDIDLHRRIAEIASPRIKYVSGAFSRHTSQSILRNRAMTIVSDPIVLLLDADIYP